MSDARSGAAAVALPDGVTLIAGGIDTTGQPTDSVVVYDPLANSFSTVGHLVSARVDHSATLLADGRVLIAGGMTNGVVSSDIEIFDSVLRNVRPRRADGAAAHAAMPPRCSATRRSSSWAGPPWTESSCSPPRFSTRTSESVTAIASSLQQARTGASATTLIDGRVLVVGGSNGSGDLATAEIFEPVGQTFTLVDTTLSVPRSGHTATLLPHNNGVLVSGGTATIVSDGTATSVPVTATDVFVPAIFTDPYTWGMGSFIQSDEMQQPRSRAVGGPAGDAGYAFAAGGGPNDAEAYRYATIATDKDDYAPGQQAIITGSGWQPLEEVTLLFQEDPAVHPDYTLTVTANANGDIYWDQWAPEEHDLGVRFYLTAQDSRSRAQTTFTDGVVSVSILSPTTAAPVTSPPFPLPSRSRSTIERMEAAAPSQPLLQSSQDPQLSLQTQRVLLARTVMAGNNESINVTVPAGTTTRVTTRKWTVVVSNPGGSGNPISLFSYRVLTATSLTGNTAPVANAQTVTTPEDTDVLITLTGSDANGDALTFKITSLPTNGTLYQVNPDNTTAGAQIVTVPTTVTNASNKSAVPA